MKPLLINKFFVFGFIVALYWFCFMNFGFKGEVFDHLPHYHISVGFPFTFYEAWNIPIFVENPKPEKRIGNGEVIFFEKLIINVLIALFASFSIGFCLKHVVEKISKLDFIRLK